MRIDLWGPDSWVVVSANALLGFLTLLTLRLSGTTAMFITALQADKQPGLSRTMSSRIDFARTHVISAGLKIVEFGVRDLEEAKQIASFNLDDLKQTQTTLAVLSGIVGLFAFKAKSLVELGFPHATKTKWFRLFENLDYYPVFLFIVMLTILALRICFEPFRWHKYNSAIDYALTTKPLLTKSLCKSNMKAHGDPVE